MKLKKQGFINTNYGALPVLEIKINLIVWKEKSQLNNTSSYLSKDFGVARFEFFGKTLNGQKIQSERWKKLANQTDGGLGELLGQLWVKKHFTPEAKQRMLELVTNLKKVYRSRIEKLDWNKILIIFCNV